MDISVTVCLFFVVVMLSFCTVIIVFILTSKKRIFIIHHVWRICDNPCKHADVMVFQSAKCN